MKISEITQNPTNESMVSGGVATVAQPMGKVQRRSAPTVGKKKKKVNESITVQNPKDLENLVSGVRAINSDTVVFNSRVTVKALKSFLKKHGYSNKNDVWRKDGNAIGIEWDDNQMKGYAVMWRERVSDNGHSASTSQTQKKDS